MNIIFIGGGHMSYALVAGLVSSNDSNHQITVIDRNDDKRCRFKNDFDINTLATINDTTAATADIIILSVRPPQMQEVCRSLKTQALLISVAAGIHLQAIAQWTNNNRVIRTIPNTPIQQASGVTVCYANSTISDAECRHAETIFANGSQVFWVKDEKLIDAAVAVSGSGPAYVYYFIEAMQRAAKNMGLDDTTAKAMILQTMRGAVKMVEKSDKDAATLRQEVAVQGGTTERAINTMHDAHFIQLIEKAMQACHARAIELGESLSN